MSGTINPSSAASIDAERGASSDRWIARVALIACGLAAVVAFLILVLRLDDPLLDFHAFRQTQTAISVWTILNGGPLIDYLTPVAGAPWAMPFEAPTYNVVVAAVAILTPLDLDASGRVTSFIFLLGTIAVGCAILRDLTADKRTAQLAFAALMFASPQYLFWGQAFLMETCATFFGAAMVYGYLRYARAPSAATLALLAIAAILCALTKTTTWLVFGLACGAHWLAMSLADRKIAWRKTAALATVAVVSGVCAVAWTAHADALKAGGLLTSEMTQSKLLSFHLGGISIRFNPDFWFGTLPFRILPDALGLGWPLLTVGLWWCWERDRVAFYLAGMSLAVFFVPMLIVMNAHHVHNYYQTANALFAVAAAAVVIAALARHGQRLAVAGGIALLIGGQLAQFAINHAPFIAQQQTQQPVYVAAMTAREMVPADRSIFVFGVDQSSEVHYYAQRRGVAFTDMFPEAKIRLALMTPDAVLTGYPLGGAVDCRGFGRKPYAANIDALIDAFMARARSAPGASRRKLDGGCEIIAFPVLSDVRDNTS